MAEQDPLKEVLELVESVQNSISGPDFRNMMLRAGREVGVMMEEDNFKEYADGVDLPADKRERPAIYRRQRKDGTHYMSKFKTAKQQGWFFASLATGTLELPYTRTGLLGASQTSDAYFDGDNLTISVGTNVAYAPYVIGEEQSFYHARNGWVRLDELIESNANYYIEQFGLALTDYWQDYLHGNINV